MICPVCKKDLKICGSWIYKHLKKVHNIDLKTYYVNYLKNERKICPYCGKDCKFRSMIHGFNKTCGDKKCVSKARILAWKTRLPDNEETKKRKSESAFKRPPRNLKTRKKMSINTTEWHKNHPEESLERIKIRFGASQTPEAKKKQAKTMRNRYNKMKLSNPSDKNCYLYIMSNNKGLIKIGVSDNPKNRLLGLTCNSHKNICIIDTYFGNYNEMYGLESKLHHKYDKYNIILKMGIPGRTEWFKQEILEDIKKDFDDLKNKRRINFG